MDPLLEQYVSADPQIHHGKACFRGTRVPLWAVLELLEAGIAPQVIVGPDYYPDLTLEHVRAALHFAAQHAKNQEYLALERPARGDHAVSD